MTDIMKLDLYSLLEVETDSTDQEIKKAYRKKALSCHPDKNPDNPKAAELFRQLSKALEILTDQTAKAAYDRLLRARKASQVRYRELDSKRKKLKDELEAREKAAEEERISETDATIKLAAEIERLRREGSKQLEKENEILKRQIEEEIKMKLNSKNVTKFKVKCKSKHKLNFTESVLRENFSKYGNISCLVMSKKTAILEFDNLFSSENNVISHDSDYFTVELIEDNQSQKESIKEEPVKNEQTFSINVNNSLINDSDYESLVLRKLKQAEERKRLIKQMEEDDIN